MHTLEPECRTLHAEGVIDDATAARALARDGGQVFSVHAELRATLYAGVLLVMSGVGMILSPRAPRLALHPRVRPLRDQPLVLDCHRVVPRVALAVRGLPLLAKRAGPEAPPAETTFEGGGGASGSY